MLRSCRAFSGRRSANRVSSVQRVRIQLERDDVPAATPPARSCRPRPPEHALFEGLLIDWGGVLTTSLFASFNDFCVRTGLDPQC